MVERGPEQPINQLESEQVKQELLDFFAGEKLGSAKTSAFFDMLQSMRLHDIRARRLNELTNDENMDKSERLSTESALRIVEMRIALLGQKEFDNESRLPGYRKASRLLERFRGDLYVIYQSEVKSEMPEEDEDSIGNIAWHRVEQALNGTRDTILKQLQQAENIETVGQPNNEIRGVQ